MRWIGSFVSYSDRAERNREEYKQKHLKQISTVRELLLISIRSSVKLCTADIFRKINSKFNCRSVIIVQFPDSGLDGSFAYLIGIHTTDASKHTYLKYTRALFPEISQGDLKAKAVKGIGSWANSLCDKNGKIILCFGEIQTDELFRIANLAIK